MTINMGGGLLGLIIYCHWKRLPVLKVLDSAALALPAGQIIGKFANIINGDTWGTVTKLPWGFKYVNPAAFLPANRWASRRIPLRCTSSSGSWWSSACFCTRPPG